MPHETPLIATIVTGLALAFVFGAIANRLRIPPLAGYLLAGIVVGPYTPGIVADQSLANELAEIGVILLMFGVGLHFSFKDLLSVRTIAVPGAVVQIAFATVLGLGLSALLGWSLGAGLIFGLALSVASTVVLLRAIQERRLIETERGRIAVGWLIVEDLAMVLALVLLPAIAGALGDPVGGEIARDDPLATRLGLGLPGVLAVTFAKVIAFVALMLIVGRRVIPWGLHLVAQSGSRELFRLAVLAIALGVAFAAAKLFGVSLALGAFFAGMILAESELSHRAAEESLPLRDAFAVLFFVSVGMLFNPMNLIDDPLPVIATLFIILIGKSVAAYVIVIAFRHPVATALTISASLAQIGEFSFILADLGVKLGVLPDQGRDLILAGAILSILLNPVMFVAVDWLQPHFERRGPFLTGTPAPASTPELPVVGVAAADLAGSTEPQLSTSLNDHVVLVGYGRVGSLVGEMLQSSDNPFIVIEDSVKVVAHLRENGIKTVVGNAADPEILKAVNLPYARQLIVAIPNAFEAGQVIEQARAVNARLDILARAHSDAEVDHLTALGADTVIMGEREIARGMIDRIGQINPRDGGPAPDPAPDHIA
jgi:monovalent cation:H+ antiporter-2, CPA2 family